MGTMSLNPFEKRELNDEPRMRAYSLSYVFRGLRHRHFLEKSGSFTVGRSRACEISVYHPDIDKIQLTFERTTDGELLLFSKSGRHPTLVNGFPVEFVKLSPGDTITVGSLVFRIARVFPYRVQEKARTASICYDSDFNAAFLKSIKKSHWLAGPLLLHILLLVLFWNVSLKHVEHASKLMIIQEALAEPVSRVELNDAQEEDPPGPLLEKLAEPNLEVQDPYQEMDDPWKTTFGQNEDAFEAADNPLGTAGPPGIGKELGRLLLGKGMHGDLGKGGSRAWREHVGRLRAKGMDIAILFDSTGSMQGFIVEVKSAIREMVEVLTAIVPDIRISLMTYKGDPTASSYVVANTPLSSDPFELFNFMRSVDISGGSSAGYAAVGTAMETAHKELMWRDDAEKAMVIVGDAPSFPRERGRCLGVARRFDGKVGAIYKRSSSTAISMEPETKSFLQSLATAGGGPFLRQDHDEEVVRRIVSAVLGTRWQDVIDKVFEDKRSGQAQWMRIIRRKQGEKDYDWLFRQFRKPKVRIELVDTIEKMKAERVVREIWECLCSRDSEPWLIQRSLYLLRSMTGIEIDYMRSSRERLTKGQLLYVSEYLKFFYGPRILDEEKKQP